MLTDVTEVLVHHATGIDVRDFTLFRTCFADQVDIGYRAGFGSWTTGDEITAAMEAMREDLGHTRRLDLNN